MVLELCEYGNLRYFVVIFLEITVVSCTNRDFLRKHRPNESDVEIQEESEENEEPEGLKESYNGGFLITILSIIAVNLNRKLKAN